MSFSDCIEFVSKIERNWYKTSGLCLSWLIVLGIGISIIAATGTPWPYSGLLLFGSLGLICSTWFYSRRPPKTSRQKVGFAVSLWCEGEKEARTVQEDFVHTLRRLIKSGRMAGSFDFLEVPPHIAERVIDAEDAQSLRIRMKSHFLIYGRTRLRALHGKEQYYLELDGVVAHKPIPDQVSKFLSVEFSELLPRRIAIDKESDLLGFQFASEWAELVAKYVIGIAAAVSGDLDYAESLFRDVLTRVSDTNQKFPVFLKLRERIPVRLFEIARVRARAAYQRWEKNHDPSQMDTLKETINAIGQEFGLAHPEVLTLASIQAFVSDHDTRKAHALLGRIAKMHRDATWHVNRAFLFAYEGNMESTIRRYRSAVRCEMSVDLLGKVEKFICWVLEQEPDKNQLYYCLGFFNWQLKGDCEQAMSDFATFVEASENSFTAERKLALRWIEEIRASQTAGLASAQSKAKADS